MKNGNWCFSDPTKGSEQNRHGIEFLCKILFFSSNSKAQHILRFLFLSNFLVN